MSDTEHIVTLGALVSGCLIVAATVIAERRPRVSLAPRLIPTTPVMFAGVLVAIMALLHLMSLSGVVTGRGY